MNNFSVLLSLYAKEHPKYFKECLDSIDAQTIQPDEIVIVLDGPITPELQNVVDELAITHLNLQIIPIAKNGGLGKALNVGLKYCSNNLIARMDTDDIAVPDRFEKQLKIFEKYPEVGVVSSWIDEFEGTPDNVISTRKLPEFHYQLLGYAKTRCPVNHPAAMFRKEVVLFAGGYMPFPLFEDYYLWIRMMLNGTRFYNIQESLLKFRTSKDMYKRRGGMKHALDEIRFQNLIRKMGFISVIRCLENILIRFTVRVIPNKIRSVVYRKLLR